MVTHAFVQEIINKISSGFVFILFCCSCARLIWAMFVIHPFTGNKSDMLPQRDPAKKPGGRPDLGNDCKFYI